MNTISDKRARQLLLQATMGFKYHDIKNVQEAGSIENWIDEQVHDVFRTSLVNRQNHMQEQHHNENWTDVHFNIAYTDMLLNRNDILRHRISYILTQLFVVSNNNPELKKKDRRLAFSKYYDGLSEHCFSDFPTLLKVMSTSPVMGQYLTYLGNDHVEGIAPDENFAREVMQLFSIGPNLLRMDGSIIEDSNDRPIPSYTQQDIEQAAKVMTGWSLNNDDWLRPMTMNESAHNTQSKTILGDTIPAGLSGEQDLDAFIGLLCKHPNTAPFVSKFFIQKMVTSNPSREYVARVAKDFHASNLDMVTLITSIVTDVEATYSREVTEDGLIRDPLIVLQHAMRALNLKLKPQYKMLPDGFSWKNRRTLMDGPSVFYHYQPEEAPNDERFDGLAAPEFKLYNCDDIHHYYAQVTDLAVRFESETQPHVYVGYDAIETQYRNVDNPNSLERLIELLDQYLFSNTMSQPMISIVRDYLSTVNRNNINGLRALIVQLILSPDFMTQGE
ncbi:DUF1800 family protein [Vibrio paucivorans]|uniref:DUF1800 domain-containing protein n=1 Tax=Vibrio paucivorans TaxID=2829489 RepID=A0A9X3CC62_9VIBR|nr:DUF1800 family protein [Vibrio paucivorans]MCW8332956.1 DUF1800 domain-containing protein [Vibrio paucivorans]